MPASNGLSVSDPAAAEALARFMPRVDVLGECWHWLGPVGGGGYGIFSIAGRSRGAHIAAYALMVGTVPAGLVVCHDCDNPMCVNPAHLFVGTVADNNRDCLEKGRRIMPIRRASIPSQRSSPPRPPSAWDRIRSVLEEVRPDGLLRGQIAERAHVSPRHTTDTLNVRRAKFGDVVQDEKSRWRLAS